MKHFWITVVALLCVVSSAYAQSHQQMQDVAEGTKYLESTKQAVLDATAGLSEAQFKFKAAPDRWSIAEIVEHIAAAEDMLRGNITENVLKAPPRPAGEDFKVIDQLVITAIPDRSHKAQAPDQLKPTNRFGSPEAALKHFTESRATTEALLDQHDDLRDHATDSPLGKKLDGYEWILFIGAHSARHTKQILEVKADPNFPKN